MCHVSLHDFQNIFSTSLENEIKFLGYEVCCMILVLFLGNQIWSLYDYQEFIQIIYYLEWLIRILHDLVRNQRKLYNWWPVV